MPAKKQEWIVIPDGLFFLLPLESLPSDEAGRLLLEDHVINYEFSARFIMENNHSAARRAPKATLSFAPFTKSGADLKEQGMSWLERLPWSEQEVAALGGSRFEDSLATKETFLKNVNNFPIVHLATHAITDLQTPSASYIAFFPGTGLRSEDFLFLDEIYSLRMDSCELMVISACETGRGEFVHNEGVISFARAFLYAGCPSTINTLWKADDHSTALILQSFYGYLEKGYTKSKALQQAKLDFIHSYPVHRNPAYWSHIILTGDSSPLYRNNHKWVWAAFAVGCSTVMFFTVRGRRASKMIS